MTKRHKDTLSGDFMPKTIGVAEVKKDFSEVISQVSLKGEQFIIERKGKPMAAIVGLKDLEMIEPPRIREKKKGLLAAIGAWEEFDDLEKLVIKIYERRGKAKERGIRRLT
jgi:prevent-host-death family protein